MAFRSPLTQPTNNMTASVLASRPAHDGGCARSRAAVALRTTTSTISHCRLEAEPGLQCGDPYPCEFWDRCTAYKPADWVFYLPRRPAAQAEALDRRGDNKVASLHEHVPEEADTATVKNPSFFTVRTRTAWSGCACREVPAYLRERSWWGR